MLLYHYYRYGVFRYFSWFRYARCGERWIAGKFGTHFNKVVAKPHSHSHSIRNINIHRVCRFLNNNTRMCEFVCVFKELHWAHVNQTHISKTWTHTKMSMFICAVVRSQKLRCKTVTAKPLHSNEDSHFIKINCRALNTCIRKTMLNYNITHGIWAFL